MPPSEAPRSRFPVPGFNVTSAIMIPRRVRPKFRVRVRDRDPAGTRLRLVLHRQYCVGPSLSTRGNQSVLVVRWILYYLRARELP
eukprot:2296092-Rhodomonas_salina.1